MPRITQRRDGRGTAVCSHLVIETLLPATQCLAPRSRACLHTSLALLASFATRAHSHKFRMLDGKGHMETPQGGGLPFKVRGIGGRLRNKDQRNWRMGVRPARKADGTVSA